MQAAAVFMLFGAENPVPRVAEAGDDVLVVVQALVQGGAVDLHVRVGGDQRPQATSASTATRTP